MKRIIVLTEDEHGSKLIASEINKYYFNNSIKIESFRGIPNLSNYLIDNIECGERLETYNNIVIVYDKAPSNPSIAIS